jgi:uncharacterized cupredoxin-like copper-binding protein
VAGHLGPAGTAVSRVASLPLAALAAASGATVAATVLSAAPASASTSTTSIKAIETDFHIALSKTSNAGHYVFDAVNKGQTTHALMITGPGITMAMTKDIQPGQSATLAVTLKKGAYDIFCPIPGHKVLGMNVNIDVGGAATASGSTAKTSGSGSSGGTSAGGGGAAFRSWPSGSLASRDRRAVHAWAHVR